MFYLVYMNVGPDSGAYLTIAITPSTTTTSTSRTWEIKVSQFLCKDRDLYVYHKVLCKNVLSINIRNCSFKKGHHQDVCNGLSDIPEDGRLSTLMLPHQVTDNILLLKGTFFTNQFYEWFKKIVLMYFIYRYEVCIRPEESMCCIAYVPCADETYSWTLDKDGSTSAAQTGSDCTADYLGITGATNECVRRPGASLTSRICGKYWVADTQGQSTNSAYETTSTQTAVQARGKHNLLHLITNV